MARRVDDSLLVTNRGRTHQYPWAEWTDGRTWEVEKGEDFECTLNSFRNGLYSIAKTLAMKVTSMTLPDEGVIRFRFVDVDGLDEDEDFPDDT
tara:strand:- start:2781 stop:3059 length:279 start_codon:yes stop_codon:yes gene_type:complete